MQVNPMKDICGLWKVAADKEGLPFGLTEHLGATFSWWRNLQIQPGVRCPDSQAA
jgi:alpha-L-fucosidase